MYIRGLSKAINFLTIHVHATQYIAWRMSCIDYEGVIASNWECIFTVMDQSKQRQKVSQTPYQWIYEHNTIMYVHVLWWDHFQLFEKEWCMSLVYNNHVKGDKETIFIVSQANQHNRKPYFQDKLAPWPQRNRMN